MTIYETITESEFEMWCAGTISDFTLQRLTEILKGEYPLDVAREDILSFRPDSHEQA